MNNISYKERFRGLDRKQLGLDLLYIVLGAFLQAFAYSLFIAPANIVPGGVYGLSIVINHVTVGLFDFFPNGFPVGVTALFFNVPLLILAIYKLGLSSGPKTVLSFVLISFFTDAISYISGGKALVEGDSMLSAFYGGSILAAGVLFIFKAGSTSAGTDVLGRVLTKDSNRKLSTTLIIIDSIVVLIGFLVFRDWQVPLYSWITIFVLGKVVEAFMPENPKKAIFIVSQKSGEVAKKLTEELSIKGTFLHGRGLYNGEPKDIIFSIVERKEMLSLRRKVKEIDESAFISTMDASKDHTTPAPPPKI
ncbi:MAG: YitT family protein [Porphyromonas sp.]|nr:YitT family protein [Porphyromonas sp.]